MPKHNRPKAQKAEKAEKAQKAEKIAVVLFNLGGPDVTDSIKPFLFNLFHDPAIIRLSQPWRWLLATLISTLRAPTARAIYANLGGGSPLLANTQEQAKAIHKALNKDTSATYQCFITMRYWHPRAQDVVQQVADFAPDRIILAPLYPQFSTTTTGSSVKEWQAVAATVGLTAPVHTLCCYPTMEGLIKAQAKLAQKSLASLTRRYPRVLFSAHGLPESIIKQGDPYQWQCEHTAMALATEMRLDDKDWVLCYQSRVGPKKWISPSTEDEIKRAGKDGKALLVVPIVFVSDHSETLVELDIEYAELAHEHRVVAYTRAPVVATHPDFIGGLADIIRRVPQTGTAPQHGTRLCPVDRSGCPCKPIDPMNLSGSNVAGDTTPAPS